VTASSRRRPARYSPATARGPSRLRSGHPGRTLLAERYVGTLRRECLDHLLIHGEQHLRRILAEYTQHYNDHRPHQARGQRPPLHESGRPIGLTARIKRRQTVHGLISEYRRAAQRSQKTPAQNRCASSGTAQAIPGRTPPQPPPQAGPGSARYRPPLPRLRDQGAGTAPLPGLACGGTSSRSACAHHH
jgi:integrase-like protein